MTVNVNGELVPLSRVTLLLERTVRDLHEITSAQDAQDLVDRVAAIRDLARRAKAGVDVENRVTALRVKAEMRMAELVDEGQERGEIATRGGNTRIPRDAGIATLPELGIDDHRLAEARALHRHFSPAVIDGAAADATERGSELSRRGLLAEAARAGADALPDLRTQAEKHGSSFERLLSAVREVGSQLEHIDLTPAERERVALLLEGCRRRIGGSVALEAIG